MKHLTRKVFGAAALGATVVAGSAGAAAAAPAAQLGNAGKLLGSGPVGQAAGVLPADAPLDSPVTTDPATDAALDGLLDAAPGTALPL